MYQGMTISDADISTRSAAVVPLASGGNEGNSGNHYGWYKDNEDSSIGQKEPNGYDGDTIEEVIDSSLKVTGAAQFIYYATPNENIFITVHIDNPDSFEIMSFTLNGQNIQVNS